MLPTTKHSLKKLEALLKELGYTVRYEKGHFTSGYCLVERRKVAIVNKFYDIEARMNVLYDIVDQQAKELPEGTQLSVPSTKLLKKLIARELAAVGEEEE